MHTTSRDFSGVCTLLHPVSAADCPETGKMVPGMENRKAKGINQKRERLVSRFLLQTGRKSVIVSS
jgi:hypothetical protein